MLLMTDYTLMSLHCLQIYLEESYRNALNIPSEMTYIPTKIGLELSDLPHHYTLIRLDRFKMSSDFRRNCAGFQVTLPLIPRFTP